MESAIVPEKSPTKPPVFSSPITVPEPIEMLEKLEFIACPAKAPVLCLPVTLALVRFISEILAPSYCSKNTNIISVRKINKDVVNYDTITFKSSSKWISRTTYRCPVVNIRSR